MHHRAKLTTVVLFSGTLALCAASRCAGGTTEGAQMSTVSNEAPAADTNATPPPPPPKGTVATAATAESSERSPETGGSATADREPGDAIRLMWVEGDVAGMTSILAPDGTSTIGFVEYVQHRRGDVLEVVSISRFSDGSSDEDRAEAQIGKTLRALRGRSVIRNTKGVPTVDITIDVVGGRITGFSGLGDERETYDEHVDLPPGTYWGPLIFTVVKNFEDNATDGRLAFRTVAPTPKPRVLDLELLREEKTTVHRAGRNIDVVRFALRPTINWLVDPIIRMIAPETNFFVHLGAPPALARFEGPRNFAGQKVRIQ